MVTTHYMDEAELCQRVGFISQGRLMALDTPARLKETQMRGQVLEISAARPDRAMRVAASAAQAAGPAAAGGGGALRRAGPRRGAAAEEFTAPVAAHLAQKRRGWRARHRVDRADAGRRVHFGGEAEVGW